MTDPRDPLSERSLSAVVLPEATRLRIVESVSKAIASIASSPAVFAANARAVERLQEALQPSVRAMSAQLAQDLQPLVDTMTRAPRSAPTGLQAHSAGSATVTVTTVATSNHVPEVSVAATDADDDGDLGEDQYHLLSLILFRLDELTEDRPMTPQEYYGLITNTLALLVSLLAWLRPMAA